MKKILLLIMGIVNATGAMADDISNYFSKPDKGNYFLYSVDKQKFVGVGGSPNGTVLSNTANEMVYVTKEENDKYTIEMSHTKYMKLGSWNGQYIWTDATTKINDGMWTISEVDGVCELTGTYNSGEYKVYATDNAINASTTATENTKFAFISEKDYDRYMQSEAGMKVSDWIRIITPGVHGNTYAVTETYKNEGVDAAVGGIYTIFGGNVFEPGTRLCKKYYNIPDGTYSVSLQAGHYDAAKSATAYIKSGNIEKTTNLTETALTKYDMGSIEVNGGMLEVGVRAGEGNPDGSMGVAYINLTLTDVQRTISSGKWNTLSLPFDLTNPEGWSVKELNDISVNGEEVSLKFADAPSIVAGKSYVVKATDNLSISTPQTKIVTNTATLASDPTVTQVTSDNLTATMTGNFYAMNVPQDAYFISDNKFWHAADATNTMKGYRAYINITSHSHEAKPQILTLDFEDDTTLVEAIESGNPDTEKPTCYSLSGQRLSQPRKGVNIMNGKKVLVK